MARLSSGFVLGVFLQVPPAASARALSNYVLVGWHVLQLDLPIQADAADAVTVPRRDVQKCGHLHPKRPGIAGRFLNQQTIA